MSGGSGYILTKEAIRRFIEIALLPENNENHHRITAKTNSTANGGDLCVSGNEGPEDLNLGNNGK